MRSAEDDDLLGDGDNPQGGDSEMKEAEDPNPNPPNNSTTAQISQTPTQNLPPQKQASLIQEGIDLAVEQLLKEISVKVMIEADMTGIKGSITLLRRKKN